MHVNPFNADSFHASLFTVDLLFHAAERGLNYKQALAQDCAQRVSLNILHMLAKLLLTQHPLQSLTFELTTQSHTTMSSVL